MDRLDNQGLKVTLELQGPLEIEDKLATQEPQETQELPVTRDLWDHRATLVSQVFKDLLE